MQPLPSHHTTLEVLYLDAKLDSLEYYGRNDLSRIFNGSGAERLAEALPIPETIMVGTSTFDLHEGGQGCPSERAWLVDQ